MHEHAKITICSLCEIAHTTTLVLTEGLAGWLLTCSGNLVCSFETLDVFRSFIKHSDYQSTYQIIIIGSVGTIIDW